MCDATLAGIVLQIHTRTLSLSLQGCCVVSGELRQIWFSLNRAERNVFIHGSGIKRGIEMRRGVRACESVSRWRQRPH